jgi:DNA-binding response OmpR family regulator/signal transduction histidine kinase
VTPNVKPHALIVDDSLTVRMDLSEAFENADFEVMPCSTLQDARAALAGNEFALIVLDVLLPDGDGVEFLQELKATPKTAAIPVMLLSTEAQVRDRVHGLKTGADEYIGKPYDSGYVVARARVLIRPQQPRPTAKEGITILVIDDSPTFRNEMREALEAAGYQVTTSSTGEDGLHSAVNQRPDAVIVDHGLPGIDGATVVRRIREDASLRRTPCLMLTASEDRSQELLALDAGADGFVRKGEDLGVVLARLAAVLRSASAPSALDSQSSVLGPKRILAVDDSSTYLEELATQLRMDGYDVVLAGSGEEALELAPVQSVDCILLDLIMPGPSGHETCRRIKDILTLRDIPLLMLTGVQDRQAMIEAINSGADDYIPKSSGFDVIRARVRAALRRKQFEDENRSVREQLLRKEMEAVEARAQRQLAEARAALLGELQKSKDRLDFALQVGGLGEWELYLKTHAMSRSLRHDQIFGYDTLLPAWNYELFLDHVLPEHRAEVDASFKAALADNCVWNVETRIRHKDGSIGWIASQGQIAVDQTGKPLTMIGIIMDITARKQAELALQEREQQLRAILNLLPVAVFMCDADGKLIDANPAADRIWEAHAPLVGLQQYHNYKGRLPGSDRLLESKDWALAKAVLHGATTLGEEVEIETFDGTRKTILNSALPVRGPQGELLGGVAVNVDITDRKQAEQALIRSEKLASAGRLAATIAHEVNNPLAAVTNALYLASSDPDLPESVRKYLVMADRELGRAAHMVKQTLGFYREVGNATTVHLWELIDEILALFETKLGNNGIQVERQYGSKAAIQAIEGEMRQVISNLIINSIDAMQQGGTLYLRTAGPVCFDHRPMLCLTVADTGVGIADEHRRKIFEPFFTTKKSFGTGLGLWVTSELLKKHDGSIRIRSRIGKGTAVSIWLPLERRASER